MSDSSSSLSSRTYRCGSLVYDRNGLLVLAIWLLGGDFAFTFFEAIFGRFIPLYLKDMNASNTLIGVMTGSFAGLVNLFFLPNISQFSDRFRSRLGRRIPFLYVVTPLTVASLTLIGFAPELADGLHRLLALVQLNPPPATTLTLVLLSAFIVSFHFFNMVLVNCFNWLLRDVVPEELMARFLAWFKIVGSLGSLAFLWFIFPHMVAYRHEVFAGIGGVYLLIFLLMCRNVREGEYPEPPPRTEASIFHKFAGYFRECLRVRIYRNFFLVYVLMIFAATCAGPFNTLFMQNTLGLNLTQIADVLFWSTVASILGYFPVGWLCDRVGPAMVVLLTLAVMTICSVLAYFLVQDRMSLLVYSVIFAIPGVGWALGNMATAMKLFPAEKFGQFSSGLNVFGYGGLIIGNYVLGHIMDVFSSNYRITFLWSAVFFALAIIPMALVIREWRQRGSLSAVVTP